MCVGVRGVCLYIHHVLMKQMGVLGHVNLTKNLPKHVYESTSNVYCSNSIFIDNNLIFLDRNLCI